MIPPADARPSRCEAQRAARIELEVWQREAHRHEVLAAWFLGVSFASAVWFIAGRFL